MRGYIVLLAVGIVAALIGVGVLAAGFSPQTHPLFFAISAGANHYVRYQFSVVTGGSVSGTFTADSGTVNVWVMTDAQHTAFIATGTLTYLSATSGASGAFSAEELSKRLIKTWSGSPERLSLTWYGPRSRSSCGSARSSN